MARREVLKGGLAAAALSALGLPEWVLPAPAQGETIVPFTDVPGNIDFSNNPNSITRLLDIRSIDSDARKKTFLEDNSQFPRRIMIQ